MRLLFILLIALAVFLRFYQLSTVPPMLLTKEMEVGLAAYHMSIFQTPLAPLSVLVTVPFVTFLGLTPFALRLPSVLFGSLAIFMFYFLSKELTKLLHTRLDLTRIPFPELATTLFALSPWHVQVSRIDTGIQGGLFFFLLGLFLLLRAVRRTKFFFLITIPFVLSIYSDYSFFLPSITVIATMLLLLRKRVEKSRISITLSILLGFVLLIPVLSPTLTVLTHIDETNGYLLAENEHKAYDRISYSSNTMLARLLYDPRIENLKLALNHFASYVEPPQLFIRWEKNSSYIAPFSGLFYPTDVLFLILGLLLITESGMLLFFLLLIGVVLLPLSFTSSAVDPLRASLLLPSLILLTSLGVLKLYKRSFGEKRFLLLGSGVLFLFFFIRFCYGYFVIFPEKPIDYPQQYAQAFSYTSKTRQVTKPIIVTDVTYGKNTYLSLLFLTKGSLQKLQTKPPSKAFSNRIVQYGNYTFIAEPPRFYVKNTVYIQPTKTVPKRSVRIFFTTSSQDTKYQVTVFTMQQ